MKGILDNKYGSSTIAHALKSCDDFPSVVKRPDAKSSKFNFAVGKPVQTDLISPIDGVYG